MLMVILGAGASYDSSQAYRPLKPISGGQQNFGIPVPRLGEGEPWRPPLAKDLFLDRHRTLSEIVTKYPKLTHILPYLREPSEGRSVEQVLEELQTQSGNSQETRRELASVRFYLCDLLQKVTEEWSKRTDGVTNYGPLIRDILQFNRSNEEVCLVTFNYDLLLERALYTFDFKRKPPEEHLDSHPILKLFKLHGSVDWSRLTEGLVNSRLLPQHLIELADIRLSDKFVLANATNPYDMQNFGDPIFPAIAIPVQTKSEEYFECPRTHLDYLVKMLESVTKILIIGWQAQEAHFLQMLKHKLPLLQQVMVVGANAPDAEKTLQYFTKEIGAHVLPHNRYVGRGGFTDFIVNREGHDFF
jgi:SIR2-like domain